MDRHPILSPQTPPEVDPIRFPDKPVAVLSGVTPRVALAMADLGLYTLADVLTWQKAGGDWTDIKGVGAKTAERISASFDVYVRDWEVMQGW